MNIEFVGPASLAADGGVIYIAKLDGNDVYCHFSYEALEDIDPESVFGDALEHFSKHQLILLSSAEKKLLKGLTHDGQLQISSSDLRLE